MVNFTVFNERSLPIKDCQGFKEQFGNLIKILGNLKEKIPHNDHTINRAISRL